MAKETPAQQTDETPTHIVPTGNGGVSIDPTLFDEMHSESMAEAGLIPYLKDEEKQTLCAMQTPLWILGARWAPSEKYGGERAELSVTTDLAKIGKSAIWGGHSDTPYWRNMVTKINGVLDMAEAAGLPAPHNIGPVYAHGRDYTNEYGTFTAYTFSGNRPGNSVTPSVPNPTDGDPELPF